MPVANRLFLLCLALGLLLLAAPAARGQATTSVTGIPIRAELLAEPWPAQWIAHPTAPGDAFGVFHFRRTFELAEKPGAFVVHTSADNGYRLFVNGTPVRRGPSRGEVPHWRFETTDLAPFLQRGENVIAAVVWNFGEHRAWAQMSYETGFVLQGGDERAAAVSTDSTWRVLQNEAYAPIPAEGQDLASLVVAGASERVEASAYPWGWQTLAFDDAGWPAARALRPGMPKEAPGVWGTYEAWKLVPRAIPPMAHEEERLLEVERAQGVDDAHDGFLQGTRALVIPPDTQATILVDQTYLTTAYPELLVSGGAGGRVKLSYAEALYEENGRKGDRDVVRGKTMRGYHDVFLPDGGDQRLYRPLWWRTYRYVQLQVTTAGDALRIHDLRGMFTAYPFEEKATFASSDPALKDIWDVGWRTARVCAGETYFDTPYWEQLQYVGDTRIQALISLYVDGDDRLARKAIEAFAHSRTSEGLTASRYPSNEEQFIPPYSLLWIAMVHDYWMHRNDPAFVEPFLTGIRGVVDWYAQYVDETGMVGPAPWWNFVDWSYDQGVPPGAEDGHSTVITLQFAYALAYAADLAAAFDRPDEAQHYRQMAASLKEAAYERAWDEGRGLLAETPGGAAFSQHANILGVLTDTFAPEQQAAVMERVLADTSLVPATYYFTFYLHRAIEKAGLGARYVDQLEPWRRMLAQNLTTFAERPAPTRSDSHAWSAHPNYNFLALVAGLRPSAPGFESVRIAPSLGPLGWVEASMPHPQGRIDVRFEQRGEDGLEGTVTLPEGLTGTLVWKGETMDLQEGTQQVRF